MKRFHVHVAVDNLADSIKFYSGMFAAEPSVVKPDYAKWMLDDPRVNFAISQRDRETGVNHLGIQVESAEELAQMQRRLAGLQAAVLEETQAACCYAKSDKYWVEDPSGIAWETFHTLDSIPVYGGHAGAGERPAEQAACCVPDMKPVQQTSCCTPGSAAAGKCC
jgi:hypothetical protein